MAEKTKVFELTDVTKVYKNEGKEFTALKNVNLDIYEGYPHLYRKETLKLKLGKKTFSAMVYIINGEKMLYGQPSKAYFETIREGYISAGFDPKLLHQAVSENCTEVRLYG